MYESRRSRVARAVLAYLLNFPDAQDTIAGIEEWWLPQQNINSHPTVLQGALNELVERGFLVQHRGKDSKVHYRLNRRKRRLNDQ